MIISLKTKKKITFSITHCQGAGFCLRRYLIYRWSRRLLMIKVILGCWSGDEVVDYMSLMMMMMKMMIQWLPNDELSTRTMMWLIHLIRWWWWVTDDVMMLWRWCNYQVSVFHNDNALLCNCNQSSLRFVAVTYNKIYPIPRHRNLYWKTTWHIWPIPLLNNKRNVIYTCIYIN